MCAMGSRKSLSLSGNHLPRGRANHFPNKACLNDFHDRTGIVQGSRLPRETSPMECEIPTKQCGFQAGDHPESTWQCHG